MQKPETFRFIRNLIKAVTYVQPRSIRTAYGLVRFDRATTTEEYQKIARYQELGMADVKLVVIYPRPKDVDAFEEIYRTEHVPLAVARLGGKTKIVASRILSSPQGLPPFHRIAEIYFPSMQALEACAASEGGKETLANAVKISTGGMPIFLVAEAETFTFNQTANA